ncbi:ankyrin repeat domain-containing protein [Chitinibacter sp. SCUT-21]|uniref:ankyrin repeat domain-containing protein n=1 Tax=Chitinibacter sp. SCUT-21 TaxID=2970891 RepID=UPI0035A61142
MDIAQRLQQLIGEGSFPQQVVTQYPHLAERLVNIWGTPAMDIFLNDLFFDRRGGRQGFSDEVMHELFALQNRHNTLFPPKENNGIWTESDLAVEDQRADLATFDVSKLIEAAKAGNMALITHALSCGVHIECADDAGLTMLWWACRYGHAELVLTLLRARASVKVADEHGCFGLHWLAAQDLALVIEEMHRCGANLNVKDHDGMTPLMYAARRGRLSAAGSLLRLGAEIDAQDERGMSALHFAADAGVARMLELLMAYSANPRLLNCQQKTAADLVDEKPDAMRLKMYLSE